jgi:hypothetical protein
MARRRPNELLLGGISLVLLLLFPYTTAQILIH